MFDPSFMDPDPTGMGAIEDLVKAGRHLLERVSKGHNDAWDAFVGALEEAELIIEDGENL